MARRAAAGAGRRCIRGGAQAGAVPRRVQPAPTRQAAVPGAVGLNWFLRARHAGMSHTNEPMDHSSSIHQGTDEHVHWSQDRSRARPRCRAPCAVRSVCPGVTNTSWPSKRTTIRPALSSRCSRALSVRWRSICRCPLPSYSMARPASASRRSGRPRCSPVTLSYTGTLTCNFGKPPSTSISRNRVSIGDSARGSASAKARRAAGIPFHPDRCET